MALLAAGKIAFSFAITILVAVRGSQEQPRAVAIGVAQTPLSGVREG